MTKRAPIVWFPIVDLSGKCKYKTRRRLNNSEGVNSDTGNLGLVKILDRDGLLAADGGLLAGTRHDLGQK